MGWADSEPGTTDGSLLDRRRGPGELWVGVFLSHLRCSFSVFSSGLVSTCPKAGETSWPLRILKSSKVFKERLLFSSSSKFSNSCSANTEAAWASVGPLGSTESCSPLQTETALRLWPAFHSEGEVGDFDHALQLDSPGYTVAILCSPS